MNRYLIFLATENLTSKDKFDCMVQNILENNTTDADVHHALVKTDDAYATVLVPYSCVQMDSNDKDMQKILSETKWTLVGSKTGVKSFVDTVKSQTEYNSSKAKDLADGLHSLADSLPRLGGTVDVVWFMDNMADFRGDLMIFGGLKRLQQWNDASITLLHATATANSDTMPQTLTDWIGSLCGQISSVEDYQRHWTLWQGRILITGSEKCLKLPGFRLEYTEPAASSEVKVKPSKKSGCVLSWTLNFIAEVDVDEVPALYLTEHCYQLNLISQSKVLQKSQQFLYRLTTAPNLCYILRLYYGTSWRDASNCAARSDDVVEKKKKKSKSWKELVKENISHAFDNPNEAELDGKLGCFHFLVRAVQVHNKSGGSDTDQSYDFVAYQMCDITDCSGSASCVASKSDAVAHKNVSFVGELADKSIAAVRPTLAGAAVMEVKSSSDRHLQPEEQLLASKVSDSDDSHIRQANDTFGRLTPPRKQKAVVLNASEIVKYFNADGTAASRCTKLVLTKKSLLRTYNSVERDGGCAVRLWPSCLQSRCHDVYYDIGKAGHIEKESSRLKSRLGGYETVSTCSTNHHTQSLLLPQAGTSRKRAIKTGLDNAAVKKRSDPATDRRDSWPSQLPVEKSQTCKGKDYTASRKRKRLGSWCPASDSDSQQEVNSQTRPAGAVNRSVSNTGTEPRSLRNKRKMEDIVKSTLFMYAVEPSDGLFDPCFRRLCTITETFIKDLRTSRGLHEEMQKITLQYAEHVIEFERKRQEHPGAAGK